VTPAWSDALDFAETVAAARDGDERAFTALWRWLHPSLVRYLRVVTTMESDDLASEVWLSVAQGLDRFSGDERAFRALVFTIARHRVVDAARRRARRVADTAPLSAIDPPAPGDAASEALIRMELGASLEIIRSLPPAQADVISLRVIGGLSVTETATVLAKSEGAVRVLAHRGLRELADRLSALSRTSVG